MTDVVPLEDAELDPADPRVWFKLRQEAIDGLLRGNKAPATRWLRWVERHRSREVAERSREDLKRAAEWQRAKEEEARRKEAARSGRRPFARRAA